MLVVISPAKRLDWSETGRATTAPMFPDDTAELVRVARGLSAGDLRRLMGISAELAALNRDRFAAFRDRPAPEDVRPAALAFAGDTYAGLEARTLEPDALVWAGRRLRILSGLYGLLRPTDGIQPYRLEMGTRLATERGRDLYAFWGDRLAEALTALGRAEGTEILVNCASKEYFTAADRPALGLRVVTPVFLEDKPAGPQIVSFHAKKARGAMARYICERRLTDPESLRDFDLGGYAHAPELSAPDRPAFLRRQAAGAAA